MRKNSSTNFQDVSLRSQKLAVVIQAQVMLKFRLTLQIRFHSF